LPEKRTNNQTNNSLTKKNNLFLSFFPKHTNKPLSEPEQNHFFFFQANEKQTNKQFSCAGQEPSFFLTQANLRTQLTTFRPSNIMYSIPALLVILNTALQTVSAVALAPEDHSHPSAVVESVQASETDKHVAARAMQSVTVHKSGNPDRLSACELCKLTIEDCNKVSFLTYLLFFFLLPNTWQGGSLEHCQKQKCGLQKCKGCSDCAGVDEYRRREVEDQEEPEVETVHAPETAPMPRSVKVAARGRCHNDCYENINLCPNVCLLTYVLWFFF
jgi:hypothetical protein